MATVNPDWVDAPYRVSFCFWVPVNHRKHWSRKRRLKWIRRETKRIMKSFRPPPIHEFDIKQFQGESDFYCSVCEGGDITSQHVANCNYANGN